MAPTKNGLTLVVDVCKEVAKNIGMGIPPVRAWRTRRLRTANQVFSTDDEFLERYAFLATRHLLGQLKNLNGLHIAEIGPGDYLTSGFALLAAGAASYAVIDRFPGNYDSPEAKRWYQAIQDAWPRLFPELPWPEYLSAANFPEGYADRLTLIDAPIEAIQPDRKYDVVCSYQVGEHVTDIEAFAKMNARLLAPGGLAAHRVDFGPHDCWFYYPDPLTFLRFPDWLWRLMGSNRGTPNRRRHHEFQAAFAGAGLQVEAADIAFFSDDRIHQERMAKRFRAMPYESMKIGTAVYLCRT
ncbi:MAG: methyltransferase domain-containing protein [Pyrinomonadaceae bacterium]